MGSYSSDHRYSGVFPPPVNVELRQATASAEELRTPLTFWLTTTRTSVPLVPPQLPSVYGTYVHWRAATEP